MENDTHAIRTGCNSSDRQTKVAETELWFPANPFEQPCANPTINEAKFQLVAQQRYKLEALEEKLEHMIFQKA